MGKVQRLIEAKHSGRTQWQVSFVCMPLLLSEVLGHEVWAFFCSKKHLGAWRTAIGHNKRLCMHKCKDERPTRSHTHQAVALGSRRRAAWHRRCQPWYRGLWAGPPVATNCKKGGGQATRVSQWQDGQQNCKEGPCLVQACPHEEPAGHPVDDKQAGWVGAAGSRSRAQGISPPQSHAGHLPAFWPLSAPQHPQLPPVCAAWSA